VVAAEDPSGIHYASPYPSVQDVALKRDLRWDLEPIEQQLQGMKHVLIAPMHPWMAHHVMCALYAHNIDFFALGPIATHFGTGDVLGAAPLPWDGDALISPQPRRARGLVREEQDGHAGGSACRRPMTEDHSLLNAFSCE